MAAIPSFRISQHPPIRIIIQMIGVICHLKYGCNQMLIEVVMVFSLPW